METQGKKEALINGKTYRGIELGFHAIKAVLTIWSIVRSRTAPTWEIQLENGIWTYSWTTFGTVFAIVTPLTKVVHVKYA
jgi:hypothetical protein